MEQLSTFKRYGLDALSEEELISCDGGDGFWYDVAYALGAFARGLKAFSAGAHNSRDIFYK